MRSLCLLIAAVALLLSATLGGLIATASGPQVAYLPVVTNGVPPQAALTTLLDCNCASVYSTLLPDGRVLLTFQDHTRGSHVFSAIDAGDHLLDVPLPPLVQHILEAQAAAAAGEPGPSFEFPGPKQAPGSAIVVGQEVRWYVPSRDDDDPTGWAKLKRLTLPVSALP